MTLRNSILMAFAAVTFVATAASAFPGRGPGRGPTPIPNPGHQQPNYPGNPGGPGYGRTEQRTIYLNQRVANVNLSLRELARIGEEFRGYSVDNVIIETRGAAPGTQLTLFTDGRQGDTIFNPQYRLMLRPAYPAVIGQDFRSLILAVRGMVDITNITVNMIDNRTNPGPGPGPGPGYPQDISLTISRRFFGNDSLNLSAYVDTNRYRGYRVEQVRVEATSVFENAFLDVYMNGYNQGPTMVVDRFTRVGSIRPTNAVLGNGDLIIYTRGDVDIHRVYLRLAR